MLLEMDFLRAREDDTQRADSEPWFHALTCYLAHHFKFKPRDD